MIDDLPIGDPSDLPPIRKSQQQTQNTTLPENSSRLTLETGNDSVSISNTASSLVAQEEAQPIVNQASEESELPRLDLLA